MYFPGILLYCCDMLEGNRISCLSLSKALSTARVTCMALINMHNLRHGKCQTLTDIIRAISDFKTTIEEAGKK